MDEKILQMATSDVWGERARAAQLIAGHDDEESETLALALLRDPGDTGVTQVALESLLEQRGTGALPLILRGIGIGLASGEYDEPAEQMLWSLDVAWTTSGLDLAGALDAALVERDGDELAGALELARRLPAGSFARSDVARVALARAAEHPDERIRARAAELLARE